MSKKLNNIAELIPIQLDNVKLYECWETFLKHHKDSIEWQFRVIVKPNLFPDYVVNLLESICTAINQQPKNYILQVFDKGLFDYKTFLNVVHKDIDRQSCITLPIIYNQMESLLFYDDILGIDPGEYRKNYNKPWPEKPIQVCRYSTTHPTLVNVQKLHNVRVLDTVSPRILLQLSFDIGFYDLMEQNPCLWQVI